MSIARSKSFLRTALLALAIPALGLSVTITGPNVGPNSTQAGSDHQTAVGGLFNIDTTYNLSYQDPAGPQYFINPVVTYAGPGALANATTITVDFLASFTDTRPGVCNCWDSDFVFNVPSTVVGNTGASSVTGELILDGTHIVAGDGSFHTVTGLNGDTLSYDFRLTYVIAAGTQQGGGVGSPSSSVPEPTEALPVGLGIAGLGYAVARRRNAQKKSV